jgi:hypothetical protein
MLVIQEKGTHRPTAGGSTLTSAHAFTVREGSDIHGSR